MEVIRISVDNDMKMCTKIISEFGQYETVALSLLVIDILVTNECE